MLKMHAAAWWSSLGLGAFIFVPPVARGNSRISTNAHHELLFHLDSPLSVFVIIRPVLATNH
ncbi:hypothetical protein BCR34DRAFT_132676 [Clohesyomyces aquaticus]|uniref:Uncharacterized protein n=1 Tax=Clohesyomyces aquaticus TaxID=1231657 RepID=A0A1Y2AAH2_9PLEO|nr:hypothetical protein BCR34DRAFT_132676 [Clohesyomyces aquaticus]